jgi:hypothetical protein
MAAFFIGMKRRRNSKSLKGDVGTGLIEVNPLKLFPDGSGEKEEGR